MAKKARVWTVADLPELDRNLEILDAHLRNLARTFGAFRGMNDRLQGKTIRGPGSATIGTIMFDQLHLMAVRIQALIAEPKFTTDVSLTMFRSALASSEIRQHLEEQATGWLDQSFAADQRSSVRGRIDGIERRFVRLDTAGVATLARVRNKLLAHITTEVDDIPKLGLGELWTMAQLVLSLGHELHVILQGHNTRYADEIREARMDAGYLIGHLRARVREEDNSRLDRLRRVRDRAWNEERGGAGSPLLPNADFTDTYFIHVSKPLDAPEAARRMVMRRPQWVNGLLALRNLAVMPFGLKRGAPAGMERIGIFPIVSTSEERVVMGFDDAHLDFRVVVEVLPDEAGQCVTATTIVRTKNRLGRLDLAAVEPFHRVIVPAILAQVGRE